MHDVMASMVVMLLSATTQFRDTYLDRRHHHTGGVQDTCSDQPWIDRLHRARGRAHDQSTLHTQTPREHKTEFRYVQIWIE